VAIVLVVATAITVTLLRPGPSPRRPGTTASAGAVDPATPTTHLTVRGAPPSPQVRGLPVTRTELALVDTTRNVTGGGTILATQRSLPTQVWSPAGVGPWPLVVFVHGYDKGPLDYNRFCTTLASSGYVVAGPSFPQEDPAQGYPLDRTQLGAEAGDVSFVIGALEQRAGPLDLAAGRIAVVGHSDGADVALLVAYGQGTADSRVSAIVADAPDPMTVGVARSTAPLLLVQGTEDSVVPYASSRAVFAQVEAPVFYVSLVGADHLPPIAGGTVWTPVLDEDVARYLDAMVADRGPGRSSLVTQLTDPPLAQVRVKA